MPSWDHIVSATQDLVFFRGVSADGSESSAKYSRRRIAATIWIPGLPVSLLLGAWTQSWEIALGAIVVLVIGLVVFAERGDRIGAWIGKGFSAKV
jgi:hypothetical protein